MKNLEVLPAITSRKSIIGELLISLNKIGPDDIENILRKQKETGQRFGDAARSLGLVTEDDINQALSVQFDYYILNTQNLNDLDVRLYSAHRPFSAQAESIRTLRSELISNWLTFGNKTIAIFSARDSENTSNISSNLAIAFAQLGLRVLLVDANLRNPKVGRFFSINQRIGLADIIASRADFDCANKIDGFKNLFVLTSGTKIPNPQELLYKSSFREVFEKAETMFDVVIYDSPPLVEYLDALPIVSYSRSALLISSLNSEKQEDLDSVRLKVKSVGAKILGSVIVE